MPETENYLPYSVFKIFRVFSKVDFKKFRKFLLSPYHNNNKVLIRLYDELLKFAPDFTDKKLTKEYLFTYIYPGKKVNEQTLRNRFSELNEAVFDYFSYEEYSKDKLKKILNLSKSLKEKQLFGIAEKQFLIAEDEASKKGLFDNFYVKSLLEISEERRNLYFLKGNKKSAATEGWVSGENRVYYFLVSLLEDKNEAMVADIEFKAKPNIDFMQMFLNNFDFKNYLEELKASGSGYYSLIAIHYYMYLTILEPLNESYFKILKDLIFAECDKFNYIQQNNFWGYLSNCILLNFISKDSSYVKESHEINKFFLEKITFPEDKPFNETTYQNTITNAIMADETDWADNFAEMYAPKLIEDERKNRYHYSKAMIMFKKKEYIRSLKYLDNVTYDFWHHKINVRLYYLRNYYELGLSEQVFSMIDSLKHFVTDTREMPEYYSERMKETLKYCGLAANARFGNKTIEEFDIAEAVKLKNFFHKDWIIEKLKEFV